MSDELRASDADREHALARLRDASAEGRLTLEELVDRTETALVARTHGELAGLTRDLPAAAPARAPEHRERPRFVVALFVPVHRRKRWRLGRRTFVFSLFAPTFFDLRSATVEEGEATITVFSVFAPVNVTTPPGVEVDTSVLTLLAPVRELGTHEEPLAGAPRIRVNGLTLFAPVFVNYARR